MAWKRIKAGLNGLLINIKEQRGWLIDKQIDVIEGKRYRFTDKIKRYQIIDSDEAEKRSADWYSQQRDKIHKQGIQLCNCASSALNNAGFSYSKETAEKHWQIRSD
jgi:uncharacterized protein YjbJ (UPF0337 family)